jgi:hypothetical protein
MKGLGNRDGRDVWGKWEVKSLASRSPLSHSDMRARGVDKFPRGGVSLISYLEEIRDKRLEIMI